jgi:hypothetical protein
MNPFRQIDWKTLCGAWLLCYVIPFLAIASLIGASFHSDSDHTAGIWTFVFLSYFIIYFFGMPVAAGYFTARFAKNRPRLHVLVVTAVAALIVNHFSENELPTQAVTLIASLCFAFLGALVAGLSSRRHEA